MNSRIKLKISGRNNDYFINLLLSKNVTIYDLTKDKKSFTVVIPSSDYKKILDIKTSYKIEVEKVFGLLYIKNLVKNNLSFIISFFICFTLLILSSFLVLDIEVVHSNSTIKKEILDDLKVYGIYKYGFKVDYKTKEKIVKKILNEEKDTLEWLEIESVGTKYIVSVVERVKNKEEDICTPTNIVAKKDAIVTRIEASDGEVKTAINRSVKKGDILISGNIYNKEEVVKTRCAKGKVFGEVWYQVHVDLPMHYHEENVTGNKYASFGIEFFNKKSKSNYKTYKTKNIDILNNKLFPIRLFYTTYMETIVKDFEFNLENVDDFALTEASKRLKNKLGKEDKIILKKILKKEVKDSRIIVGVFFKVEENITKEEKIDEVPLQPNNEEKDV